VGGLCPKTTREEFWTWRSTKSKKCKGTMLFEIIAFFGNKLSYSKNDLAQKTFLKDLSLYIVEGYHLLFSVENP